MPNLLADKKVISISWLSRLLTLGVLQMLRVFDLKGSTRNRYIYSNQDHQSLQTTSAAPSAPASSPHLGAPSDSDVTPPESDPERESGGRVLLDLNFLECKWSRHILNKFISVPLVNNNFPISLKESSKTLLRMAGPPNTGICNIVQVFF